MKKLSPQLLETLHENHNRNIDWMERSNADVLVHSSEDPPGYVVPTHSHSRTQLLCVFSGVVLPIPMLPLNNIKPLIRFVN